MLIVVADDAVLLREGLVRLLAEEGHQVAAAVGDGPALVEAVLRHRPDVSIVDVRMPPTHTDEGLRAAVEVRQAWPQARIMVLSQYVEVSYADELLASGDGGTGYLLKDRVSDLDDFLVALATVGLGSPPARFGSASRLNALAARRPSPTTAIALRDAIWAQRARSATLQGAGLAPDRVFVKHNLIPRRSRPRVERTPTVVYAGRLDEAKGARLLMAGWDRYLGRPGEPGLNLVIVGGGPLEDEVAAWASARPSVATSTWCPADCRVFASISSTSTLSSAQSTRSGCWGFIIGSVFSFEGRTLSQPRGSERVGANYADSTRFRRKLAAARSTRSAAIGNRAFISGTGLTSARTATGSTSFDIARTES